jgi:ADP-ribosylation factor-like protein 2
VPTIGFQPKKFTYGTYDVNLIESGGGERVRDLYKHYVAECFGFIFVVDSSNVKRIEECKKELHKFMENDKVSGKAMLM